MGAAVTRPVLRSDLVAAADALLRAGHRLAAITGHHDDTGLRVAYTFTRAGHVEELVVSMPLDDARVPSIAVRPLS